MEPRAELDEIRLSYLEALEAGRAPSLAALTTRHPQFAPELTDMVLALLDLEAAPLPAPAPDPALARMRAFLNGTGETLAQARKSVGWSPANLAARLDLPARMVTWLEQGALRELPERLELRLAELLSRSREQVRRMLEATPGPRPAAAHFHATGGAPRVATARPRSFQEALAECDRQEPLSDAQRQAWLETD